MYFDFSFGPHGRAIKTESSRNGLFRGFAGVPRVGGVDFCGNVLISDTN